MLEPIIYEPPEPYWERRMRLYPKRDATKLRPGTVIEDAEGGHWEVYFDTQDRQNEWREQKRESAANE